MNNTDEADRAIAGLIGADFEGRALNVNEARPKGLRKETTMETFNKRKKEMQRQERQRDKAAKRKEIKARKAAGITSESDRDSEAPENAAASDSAADLSTLD
jgi:hypothetical protein